MCGRCGAPAASYLASPARKQASRPELAGDPVVGMPADGEGQDHDPGREVADVLHHEPAGVSSVLLEMGVGQAGVPPLGHAQDRGGPLRLLGPQLGAAPGAGLAGGEVQDAGAVARRRPPGAGCRRR